MFISTGQKRRVLVKGQNAQNVN